MFGQVMRDLELNPHEILQALEEHLRLLPSVPGREMRVAPSTQLLFKLALLHASRCGRHTIEAADLFSAIFEETQGIPVSIVRRHGVEPEAIGARLAARMRDHELREERPKKRLSVAVPEALATNLNQARQDKIPPVFGRDAEMTACSRSSATASAPTRCPRRTGRGQGRFAEGLARRMSPRPAASRSGSATADRQPADEHDGRGTMLRGMFEDRIQNVIRDQGASEPDTLIDEVHTMTAPARSARLLDAANVFKSVLARGEVRDHRRGTTLSYKESAQEDERFARGSTAGAEPTIDETARPCATCVRVSVQLLAHRMTRSRPALRRAMPSAAPDKVTAGWIPRRQG